MSTRALRIIALLVIGCAAAAAPAEDPKTVLFYGNSFTLGIGSSEALSFGGVPEVVKQLAVAAGRPEPLVENAAVSGQTLAWHLANNTAVISDPLDFAEFPDFQWDAVVIQEFSTNPTHIGNPAAFRANASTLFGLVRGHSAAARAVLFETWARGPGHSYYTGNPPTFPGGPSQMQQELRDNYELARLDLVAAYGADSATVAPVGDAWESTGWDNLHAADIYHASTRGTYLTGLVIFGAIYDEPTSGLPKLFASLSASEAAALQAVADAYLPGPSVFDGDGDGDIDADDSQAFAFCMAGPVLPYAVGHYCLRMDGDGDDDVDVGDWALMQAAYFVPPPALCFDQTALTFSLAEGTGVDDQAAVVFATDASTPSVALSALDVHTQAPPTWLTVPASVGADAPFTVDVNVTGLATGSYFARLTATSAGYEVGTSAVTLVVTPANLTILVDFGADAITTPGGSTSWNNVTTGTMTSPLALVDSTGLATGVTLAIPTDMRFNGSNTSGTTSPAPGSDLAALGFPASATQDSLFGNDVAFGAGVFPVAQVVLSDLDATATYELTFAASRLGVGDIRTTDYEVAGAATTTVTLDAANNDSAIAIVSGVVPDSQDEIVITIDKGATNSNSNGFYYLGVMRIIRTSP